MSNISTIRTNPCEQVIECSLEVTVEDSGQLLIIPVHLKCVRPCKKMLVGVIIYLDDIPYSFKTKRIYTDSAQPYWCDYCSDYHHPSTVDVFAGNFEFVLDSTCCSQNITANVIANYIV